MMAIYYRNLTARQPRRAPIAL